MKLGARSQSMTISSSATVMCNGGQEQRDCHRYHRHTCQQRKGGTGTESEDKGCPKALKPQKGGTAQPSLR